MKNFLNRIKDNFEENEKKKVIGFISFYAVFFVILFIIMFSHRDKDFLLQEYERLGSSSINLESIMKCNYFFDYKVSIDDVKYDYYGKRLNDIRSFKYNNQDYYQKEDSFFMNQGIWVKTNNPIVYYDFFQEDTIQKIVEQATPYSEKSYENGSVDYYYYLSSNTLYSVFYQKNTDYDEVPNEMVISMDKDQHITKIVYHLNSYCATVENCNQSLDIEADYELFGSIQTIDNPLE